MTKEDIAIIEVAPQAPRPRDYAIIKDYNLESEKHVWDKLNEKFQCKRKKIGGLHLEEFEADENETIFFVEDFINKLSKIVT